jgi:hypothetical protein
VNEKTGEIFVVDKAKDAVDRYTSSGVLIEEILGSSTKAGAFNFSTQSVGSYNPIVVDNSGGPDKGNFYVGAEIGERIFAFKLEAGVYKEFWEVGKISTGLAVDKFGNPWFTAFYEQVAVELDPSNGAIVKQVTTPGVEDESIAFGSEDHMFVTSYTGDRVAEFDPVTGNSLGTVTVKQPVGITVDPTTNNRFVVVQPSGVEILTPAGATVPGTPFFTETPAVAVNGAAGKMYTTNKNTNKIEVWHIAQHVPVSVAKTGGGIGLVTSVPAGIECGSTCSATSEEGDTVVLTATPDSGSAVAGWAGCAFEPSPDECEVNVGQVNSVTVDFAKALSLNVSKSGSGTVTSSPAGIDCGATCSASFLEGAKVTLTAVPPAHSRVVWQGCAAEPVADKCEVTVNSAMSVSAAFSPIMHALTVTTGGNGSGSVTCNGGSCAASYSEGTTIALAGSAASGSSFAGFSGAGCSGTTCTVTLEGDTTVTATFNVVSSGGRSGAGGGTPTPTPTPAPGATPKSKPVAKPLKCKRGFVKRKVHGKARCVKAKKHSKSKQHGKKH